MSDEKSMHLIRKVSSGKFILTCIGGVVFAGLAFTGKLPADDITKILLIIIYAYFTKQNVQK